MGRLIKALILSAMLLLPGICRAQWAQQNTDWKTIKQVEENTVAIQAVGDKHNEVVDSIKKKQSKLSIIFGTILANRQVHQEVMKNVKGFGTESKIYRRMVSVGIDIVNQSARAIDLIHKSNLIQKAVTIGEVAELVTTAISVGKIYADVVTNCNVKNPIQKEGVAPAKGDGDKQNLLNRDERIAMANKLLDQLEKIDRQLINICFAAKYSTMRELVKAIDAETWYNFLIARSTSTEIIRQWNILSK